MPSARPKIHNDEEVQYWSELKDRGLTIKQISKQIGVDAQLIRYRLKQIGVVKPNPQENAALSRYPVSSNLYFARDKEVKTLPDSHREFWKMIKNPLNPDECWKPQTYQRNIILDEARYKFAIVSRGGGKSELAKTTIGGYIVNSYKCKRPYRILVVGPERKLTNIIWERFQKDIVGDIIAGTYDKNGILPGLEVNSIKTPQNHDYEGLMSNGTYIRTATAKNYLTLLGYGWDLIITDETGEFNRNAYIKMMGSLTRPDRLNHLLSIGTPTDFFMDLYKRAKNITDNRVKVWTIANTETKYKDDEAIILQKLMLSDAEYQREFGAKFVALEGQVYSQFTEFDSSKPLTTQHNMKANTGNYPFDPTLPTFFAIDFGKSPVCLVIQEDDNYKSTYFKERQGHLQGRRSDYGKIKPAVYVIDEFNASMTKGKFTIEQFGEAIMGLIVKYRAVDPKFLPVAFYGDPQGWNNHTSVTSPLKDIPYLENVLGLQVQCQNPHTTFTTISLGVKVIQSFVRDASENPYLFVDQTHCQTLIENIKGLRFPTDKSGRAISESPLPDNLHEHACDALRYYYINRPFGQFTILALLGEVEMNKAGIEKMLQKQHDQAVVEEEDSFICF